MMRNRVEGWSTALGQVVRRHHATPFAWGSSDCAVMCGDVIKAVRGYDVLDGFSWSSKMSAARALVDAGAHNAVEFFTAGLVEIDPRRAMRGDLCMVESGDLLMSPAVMMGELAASKNEDGAVLVPRDMIVRAWAL